MRIEPPREQIWVRAHLVVRGSPIAGSGLFTTRAIPRHTVVLRAGGRLVDSNELNSLIAATVTDQDAPYVDSMTIDEDRHLVLPASTPIHFVNHSCDPNLWCDGAYTFSASRDVSEGEELTIDYGTISGAAGFSMACDCHRPRCRGRVTSDDWRDPDLQMRYDGHWSPALRERIRSTRT